MGWWKIDPSTGMPAQDASSKLSRPGGPVLLNAVPGVDDEDEAHYLGDGPWDMVHSYVGEIEEALGDAAPLSDAAARGLLLERIPPPALASLPVEARDQVLRLVAEMWKDIDWCYEEDWERPARPAERRWVGENALRQLTHADD